MEYVAFASLTWGLRRGLAASGSCIGLPLKVRAEVITGKSAEIAVVLIIIVVFSIVEVEGRIN